MIRRAATTPALSGCSRSCCLFFANAWDKLH
jgi:hypothetical protein